MKSFRKQLSKRYKSRRKGGNPEGIVRRKAGSQAIIEFPITQKEQEELDKGIEPTEPNEWLRRLLIEAKLLHDEGLLRDAGYDVNYGSRFNELLEDYSKLPQLQSPEIKTEIDKIAKHAYYKTPYIGRIYQEEAARLDKFIQENKPTEAELAKSRKRYASLKEPREGPKLRRPTPY